MCQVDNTATVYVLIFYILQSKCVRLPTTILINLICLKPVWETGTHQLVTYDVVETGLYIGQLLKIFNKEGSCE